MVAFRLQRLEAIPDTRHRLRSDQSAVGGETRKDKGKGRQGDKERGSRKARTSLSPCPLVFPCLPLSPSRCHFAARPVKIGLNASRRCSSASIVEIQKWKTQLTSNSITQSFAKTCASRRRII